MKKYCRLCKKKEERNQCGYGPKMWDKYSVNDANDDEIKKAAEDSGIVSGDGGEGGMGESHVSNFSDTVLEGNKSGDNSLRDWFSKSRSSDGKPGWVQLGGKYAGKPCAKQPGQTTKPKCGSSKMKRNLSKDEEEAAFRRKNKQDPNPNRKGKAINVKTESNHMKDAPSIKDAKPAKKTKVKYDSHMKVMAPQIEKEEVEIQEEGKKDACYHKVKSRYSVWPSAYASGALVKCRKKGAKNWGNKAKKEEFKPDNKGEIVSELSKDTLLDYRRKASDGMKSLRAYANLHGREKAKKKLINREKGIDRADEKITKSMGESAMPAEIDAKAHRSQQRAAKVRNLAKNGATEGERSAAKGKTKGPDLFGENCWPGYEKKGMKTMFGKRYPNCVKKTKTKKEEVELTDAYGKTFAVIDDVIQNETKMEASKCPRCGQNPCVCTETYDIESMTEATRIPAKTGNIIQVFLSWRGRMYVIKMFFPSVAQPSRSEVQDQLDKVYPGSRVQSYKISEIKPGEQFLHTEETELEEGSPAWQRKEGKSASGGLNAKGVASYRAANPGSKLKTAVTTKPSKLKKGSKASNRRKSFCSRMKGMKAKLTSAKTARDPDSRINKSLRKWNC